MIAKQDILDRAAEWALRPDVVEKISALRATRSPFRPRYRVEV